jgi:hypothetical protein
VNLWITGPFTRVFTKARLRVTIFSAIAIFLTLRITLGLMLNFALERATTGTLGLQCKVGSSALNLTGGSAVLTDVALLTSSGTPVASIGRAELILSWTSLPNLIVDHVAIEDVEVDLKRDANGKIPAFASLLQGTPGKKKPETRAASTSDAPLPIVLLRRLRVHHILVKWEDETIKPAYKGEVLLDMRGDEIATFPRSEPPSFSLKLVSPGVLDDLRIEVGGRRDADSNIFDFQASAQAHPRQIAPYLGSDVEVTARNLALDIQGHANAHPSYVGGGKFYSGQFTLERISLKADDDEVNLGRIDAIFSHLSKEQVLVSSLAIDRPRFSLGRLPDGALHVLGLAPRGKGNAKRREPEPEPAAAPSTLPPIHVGQISLNDLTLHFRDDCTRVPVTLDVSCDGQIQDMVYDREGPGHRARLEGTCSIDGVAEKLAVSGSFVPAGDQREAQLDFTGEGITLKAISPYLERMGFEPDLKNGTAHAALFAQAVRAKDGSLGFKLDLTKATYKDADELMGLQAFRVEGGSVARDGAVTVERISVEDPRIEARRHKSGAIAIAGIRTSRTPPPAVEDHADEEEEAPPPSAEPTPAASKLEVKEISFQGGKLMWKDDALSEPVQLALDAGTLELRDLVPGSGRAAVMRASAKLVPNLGDISLEARLVADPGAPAISGTFAARDVSMKALASYFKSLSIDPTLERGRFEAGLQASARIHGPKVLDGHVVLAPITVKAGVTELVGVDSIEVAGMSVDPATKTTKLGDLTVTGVRGRAGRDAQGAVRFLGLKINPKPEGEAAPAETAPVVTAAPSRGTVEMGKVALRGASFYFHDELVQPPADVLLERLDMTLGPRRLGRDPRPGDPPVPFDLHAVVDRVATVDAQGGIVFAARSPAFSADLHVSDLTLAAVAPYLAASGTTPLFENGSLAGKLGVQATVDPGITSAKVELTGLTLKDGENELLGLDSARVPVEIDNVANTFHLGEVALTAPRIVASRTKNGDLVACGVRLKSKPEGETKPAPAAAPAKPAKPMNFSMDGLGIQDLALDWLDEQAGGAHFALKKGSVGVGPLRPKSKIVTPWKLHADCGNLGELSFNGICALSTKTTVDAQLRMEHMNGREISPYLGGGTTLDLDDGTFAFKLGYLTEPGQAGGERTLLSVTNLVLIEQHRLLFGWDALTVDIPRQDAATQTYVIDDASVANLRGEVVKLPAGRTRFFGLLRDPNVATGRPEAPPKKAPVRTSEPPPLPTLTLKNLALSVSLVTVHDRTVETETEPPPFFFQNTLLRNTVPFELQSDDPTTAVLDLALSVGSGGSFDQATATLHAIPFDAEPQVRLELDVKGIDGAAIERKSPGIAAHYDLSALRGARAHASLNLAVKSHTRLDQIGVNREPLAFELDLDSLDVKSTPEGPTLLGCDEILLDVPTYDLNTGAMHIRKLEITNPVGFFEKEQGGFRTVDVLMKNQPPSEQAQASSGGSKTVYLVDKLSISDGDISYLDSSTAPSFRLDMRTFEIQLLGLTSDWRNVRRPIGIKIKSRAGTWDGLSIRGQLALAPRLEGDLDVKVFQYPLEGLSWYTKNDPTCGFWFTGGTLDLEMRASFKKGRCKSVARLILSHPEVGEPEGGSAVSKKLPAISLQTALNILEDQNGEIPLDEPVEFEINEDLTFKKESLDLDLTAPLLDAVKNMFKGIGGDFAKLVGSKEEKQQNAGDRKRPPIVFGTMNPHLTHTAKAQLDQLVEELKADPLLFVGPRAEIGRLDVARAREIAAPSAEDRRDLIARLEAERARLERRRADAVSAIRGSLQAGTGDVGVGRARVTEVTSLLTKIDRSLDTLYEQEREGAAQSAERRAREIQGEISDARIEAITAYLVSKGAPADHVKPRPARLRPVERDEGIVAIEVIKSRPKIEQSAVQQKPEPK